MAIATLSSVQQTDPWAVYDTDEVNRDPSIYPQQIDESTRRTQQFEYTPVTQQDLDNQALQRDMQMLQQRAMMGGGGGGGNAVDQSKAATAAAYKYIAFRGYQQALKNGQSASEAFAEWGPLLVADGDFGNTAKALQNPPEYTYNEQRNAYEAPGQKPVFNPHVSPESPTFVPANPVTGEPAHYAVGGKVQMIPDTSKKLNPIDQAAVQEAAHAEAQGIANLKKATTPEEQSAALGMVNWARNQRNVIAKRNGMSQIAPPQAPNAPIVDQTGGDLGAPPPYSSQPGMQPTAPPPPATTVAKPSGNPKVGEIRKGHKFLGGNPALASNWQKVI